MPIHEAARHNLEDVVDVLLRHGSSLTSRNNVSSNNNYISQSTVVLCM